jgi:hypothetical protein
MIAIAGVFRSQDDARVGCAELAPLGIPKNHISILTPHGGQKEIDAVPVTDGEQPGMGKAMGASIGAAAGLAAGELVASLLIPGVGPVLAIGLVAAALGAVGGGVAGGAAENWTTTGLPAEEMYIYEDALRQGRTVAIVLVEHEKEAEAVRGVLERAGAESIDRAREMWWVGLREIEKESYEMSGGNFQGDERYFRSGFEAAQHTDNRGKSYEECKARLGEKHPDSHQSEAFRRGFDRGRAYLDTVREHGKLPSRK